MRAVGGGPRAGAGARVGVDSFAMPDPAKPPLGPGLAKVGQLVSAFGLFLCGFLAMQTTDWRKIVLYAVLALGAGLAASIFSRMAR